MKQNESSITALVTAFSRAYHSQHDQPKIFDDFIAKELLTQEEFSMISENMINGIQFFNPDIAEKFKDRPEEILRWITQVQLSPTPLARAAFCEKVLLNEVKLGVEQYLVLGAGLDTFCYRHPELKNRLEIFEVDYPATQDVKLNKLTEAHLEMPNQLHFVSMDFTKKFSLQNLIKKGFAENKKTFVSFLGVSYYLTKEENSNLLKYVFSTLPPGSSIVFDYPDETLFKEKGRFNRVENMLKLAEAGGEPMKSCFTYHEIQTLLEEAGLLIYEHLTPDDIQERFFKDRIDYLSSFETINFIHAVKR